MASDPLRQWRRKPQDEAPPPSGQPTYEAYKAVDRKPENLEIRKAGQLAYVVEYRYRLYMTHDGKRGTIMNLVFSFMVVEVRGRNLQSVIAALADRRCDFIQEFDAREFNQPQPDVPLIESITITTGQKP